MAGTGPRFGLILPTASEVQMNMTSRRFQPPVVPEIFGCVKSWRYPRTLGAPFVFSRGQQMNGLKMGDSIGWTGDVH